MGDRQCDGAALEARVWERLSEVIAPDVGLAVTRMGCVNDLHVAEGRVSLVFRPSSPVCPVAFHLASTIQQAVGSVPGVTSVTVHVTDYDRAHELEALLADDQPTPADSDP